MKTKIIACWLLMIFILSCKNSDEQATQNRANLDLVYLSVERLEKVKKSIEEGDPYFVEAFDQLIAAADEEMGRAPNPVINKTQIPPSGDKHDYMSIAPYRWHNPATSDGVPWIVKDGEINPMTRGDNTDQVRMSGMFGALNKLSLAYYFSDEIKYANKAKSIIKVWFMDDATKVNPHINFGQGIPGEIEGRRAGIIEWRSISTVINTIQLLKSEGMWTREELDILNAWISKYYTWLKTSQLGIDNDNGLQNHSTCYDYQMVGLARYLGLEEEAVSRLEAAKINRIATQIRPDGTQPLEIGRTKSIHYCSMNLRVMSFVAEMGIPLGVNLWDYTSPEGSSMRKAFEFLQPFAEGKSQWTYKQITEGGVERAIEEELKPLFCIASSIFNEELIDQRANAHQNLKYMDRLQYPPLSKLK